MPTCLDDRRQETAGELETMRRWRGAAVESEKRVPRRWRVRIVADRGGSSVVDGWRRPGRKVHSGAGSPAVLLR